jgi:hypothetical protein
VPAIPVSAKRVLHQDIFVIILRGREVLWNLAGRILIVNRETKKTIWPFAATEGTNMLFILFL